MVCMIDVMLVKKCNCGDFNANARLLLDVMATEFSRDISYRGKLFDYCPWCGRVLENLRSEDETVL